MNENLGRLYNKLAEMITTGQYKSKGQLMTSLNLIKEDAEFSSKYGINGVDFETCVPLLLDLYDKTSSIKTPVEVVKPSMESPEENHTAVRFDTIPKEEVRPINGIDINNLGQYETEYLLKNEQKNLSPTQIEALQARAETFKASERELKFEQSAKIKLLRPNSNTFRKTAFIDLLILSILSFGFSLGVLVYILYKASN